MIAFVTRYRMSEATNADLQDVELNESWDINVHFATSDRVEYSSAYECVATVKTAKEWAYVTNTALPTPSIVSYGEHYVGDRQITGYSVFRSGVKPEWEDPVNEPGFEMCLREGFRDVVFDQCWLSLMAIAIGETLDGCVGVRVVAKSGNGRMTRKIEAWLGKDANSISTLARLRADVHHKDSWRLEMHGAARPPVAIR